ncbi:MAG: hypothetical protein R2751_02080 [Bacteroidales bacterium]
MGKNRSRSRAPKRCSGTLVAILGLLCLAASCDTENPEVDYTDIAGVFTCSESSAHSGIRKYIVEIDKVNDQTDLYIVSNFHNQGQNEFLWMERDGNLLQIDQQGISGLNVDGTGSLSEDFRTIVLNYRTDDGLTVLDYNVKYSR